MKLLAAILLFLLGLALGFFSGQETRDPAPPYMPKVTEAQNVATELEKEADPEKKRVLCDKLRKLTDELKAAGGPKVLVDAAESDLKTFCSQ